MLADYTPTGNDEIDNYYKQLENENNNKTLSRNSTCVRQKSVVSINSDPESSSFNRYKKVPMVALDNDIESDYMSLVVQGLANIKSIILYYLQNIDLFRDKVEDIPLSYAFSRIIFHLWPYPQDSLDKSYSLSSFQKIVTYLNPIFNLSSSKNPVDFIIFLLDALHNEDKMINNNNNAEMKEETYKKMREYLKYLIDNENSIALKTFCWISQKVKHCSGCNTQSIIYQKFFTFDLNLEGYFNEAAFQKKNEIHILDLINFYKKQKKLYNLYCPACQRKTNFELDSTIIIYPEVFVLLIRLTDKCKLLDNYKVIIDENIDLMDFNDKKEKYDLLGLIATDYVQTKDKKKKINYIAYYNSPVDKRFYSYIGKEIKNCDKKNVIDINRYEMYPTVLFYQKRKDS